MLVRFSAARQLLAQQTRFLIDYKRTLVQGRAKARYRVAEDEGRMLDCNPHWLTKFGTFPGSLGQLRHPQPTARGCSRRGDPTED